MIAGKSYWTPEREAELRRHWGNLLSLPRIASVMGLTYYQVRHAVQKLNLPERDGVCRPRRLDRARVAELYHQGCRDSDIALQLEVSDAAVAAARAELGLATLPRPPRLVYDRDVLRRMWLAGDPNSVIAAAIGCNPYMVVKLARRDGLPCPRPKPPRTAPLPAPVKPLAAALAESAVRRLAVPRVSGLKSHAAVRRPLPAAAPHPICATGGRYAALAKYAAAQGITHAQALRLWHQHRTVPSHA